MYELCSCHHGVMHVVAWYGEDTVMTMAIWAVMDACV